MIDPKTMSVLSYASGFTLWYAKEDSNVTQISDVTFNTDSFACMHLREGDVVIVEVSSNEETFIGSVRRNEHGLYLKAVNKLLA